MNILVFNSILNNTPIKYIIDSTKLKYKDIENLKNEIIVRIKNLNEADINNFINEFNTNADIVKQLKLSLRERFKGGKKSKKSKKARKTKKSKKARKTKKSKKARKTKKSKK